MLPDAPVPEALAGADDLAQAETLPLRPATVRRVTRIQRVRGAGRTSSAHRAGAGRPGQIRRVKLRRPWVGSPRAHNLFYGLGLADPGIAALPGAQPANLPAVSGPRDLVTLAPRELDLRRGMGCGTLLLLILLITGGTYAVVSRSHDGKPAAVTSEPPKQDLASAGEPAESGPEKQS